MADHYFAVTGSGSGTGADADNPQTFSSINLNAVEGAASSGDTIYFLDGRYEVTFTQLFDNRTSTSITYKSLNFQGATFYKTLNSGDNLQEAYIWASSGFGHTVQDFVFENVKLWHNGGLNKLLNCKIFTTTDLLSGARGIIRGGSTNTFTIHDCSFHYKSAEGNTMLTNLQSGADIQRCTFGFDLSAHTSSVATATGLDNAATLKNCIISADASTYISGSILEFSDTAVNCCINNMGAVNDQGGGTGDGTNNVFADPQFVDLSNGDLRLRPSSPCIGAGTAS